MQKISVKQIHTDLSRFQNRSGAYSVESVDRIVKDYDERLMRLNPITIWEDPNGKYWLLAGHSRLEAHHRLGLPDIFAAFFEGTEPEAIEYARNSNNLGTRETYLERVKLYREKYTSLGLEGITQYMLQYEEKRSVPFLTELLHLSPYAKTMQALAGVMDAQDQNTRSAIETIASMVGRCRILYADKLTDAHENEMFDYLIDNNHYKSVGKQKFIAMLRRITAKEAFGKNSPLNLAGKTHKPTAIKAYEIDEQQKLSEIATAEQQIKELHIRLCQPIADTDRNRLLAKRNKLIGDLDYLHKKLSKLRSSKAQYEDAAAAELLYDLFSPPPMKVAPKQTTLKDVAKTTERTAYTLNGVATDDLTGMVPIVSLKAGDKYRRKNKPTYKEWEVLDVLEGGLKVKSGDNNIHVVKTEANLLVYKTY